MEVGAPGSLLRSMAYYLVPGSRKLHHRATTERATAIVGKHGRDAKAPGFLLRNHIDSFITLDGGISRLRPVAGFYLFRFQCVAHVQRARSPKARVVT
jgi:hypothetical protein